MFTNCKKAVIPPKVQSILQETIQHRLLIKTLEGDSAAVDRLEDTQSVLRSNVVKRTKFSVFSYLVLNLGFSIGYLIAFTWAAVRLSGGTYTRLKRIKIGIIITITIARNYST